MDALNLRSRRPCPFSTCEYLQTFLAHDEFRTPERELLFLAAFERGQLVGYLPLRKHRVRQYGVSYGRVGVLIGHDTDRPHVVARREDEPRCVRAFYEYLLNHERGWSLLELALQDEASGLLEVPRLNPLRFWSRRFENMPVSRVELTAHSLAEYVGGLGGHQRKNFARVLRRTLEAGRAEVVSCSDPAGLRELLELYLGLERRSWKAAARAGIERDPRRVAFFRALTAANQPMAMRFQLLLLDDLPISGAISGRFAGVEHGFEMCFDQDYESLAPGHLLMLAVFRDAIASDVSELNLNGNYAYNKALFGAVATPTVAVQVYRVGGLPWLKAQAGLLKRRLAPPVVEAQRFNPERRAHEQHVDVRPARVEERERVRVSLAALEARGVKLERLPASVLEHELSQARKKAVA